VLNRTGGSVSSFTRKYKNQTKLDFGNTNSGMSLISESAVRQDAIFKGCSFAKEVECWKTYKSTVYTFAIYTHVNRYSTIALNDLNR